MAEQQQAVKELCARLEREVGVNVHRNRIAAELRGGLVHLEGEVDDIMTKRRAARVAVGMFGAERVEDCIAVRPAQERADGAIRDGLVQALGSEPVFRRFGLNLWLKEQMQVLRDLPESQSEGHLDLLVDNGAVTLSGQVWSLSHRRMAELLAWWTPGVRLVMNRIQVVPHEDDHDHEVTDAIRLAFDKDPLVHSEQIRVTTSNRLVTLEGLVAEPEERRMAEMDAWIMGDAIDGLENRIQVLQEVSRGGRAESREPHQQPFGPHRP